VHQNGLNLVVLRMTYGDSVSPDLSGYLGEERIAQFAGGLFKRAFSPGPVGGYILGSNSDGNTQRAGEVGHVFGISPGLNPPNLMVEMSYVKPYPQRRSPSCQDV